MHSGSGYPTTSGRNTESCQWREPADEAPTLLCRSLGECRAENACPWFTLSGAVWRRCESDHSPPEAPGCNLHQFTRRAPQCAAILSRLFMIPAIPRHLIPTFRVLGRISELQQHLLAS